MDHQTAALANPRTVAEKESDAPCAIVAAEGVMVIDTEAEVIGGASVETTADALAVASATLVATTW
jgi:hypothetical protein